jgi:hypothetical protein
MPAAIPGAFDGYELWGCIDITGLLNCFVERSLIPGSIGKTIHLSQGSAILSPIVDFLGNLLFARQGAGFRSSPKKLAEPGGSPEASWRVRSVWGRNLDCYRQAKAIASA